LEIGFIMMCPQTRNRIRPSSPEVEVIGISGCHYFNFLTLMTMSAAAAATR
jgi:hypothetical protein